MSRAFRTLVRGRAETDWDSILHERCGVEIRSERCMMMIKETFLLQIAACSPLRITNVLILQ